MKKADKPLYIGGFRHMIPRTGGRGVVQEDEYVTRQRLYGKMMERHANEPWPPPPDDTTYVYLFGVIDEPMPVKIGHSVNPWVRLADARTLSPVPIELRAGYRFTSLAAAREAELLAHKQFHKERIHGEWFNAIAKDVSEWIEDRFAGTVRMSNL